MSSFASTLFYLLLAGYAVVNTAAWVANRIRGRK